MEDMMVLGKRQDVELMVLRPSWFRGSLATATRTRRNHCLLRINICDDMQPRRVCQNCVPLQHRRSVTHTQRIVRANVNPRYDQGLRPGSTI